MEGRGPSLSVLILGGQEPSATRALLEELRVLQSAPGLERVELVTAPPAAHGRATQLAALLERATCEIVALYDPELGYAPEELIELARGFVRERADAVFGVRQRGDRTLPPEQRLAAALCSEVTGQHFSEVYGCCKLIRRSLLQSIPLESEDFRLEIELAIKLVKRGARLFEIALPERTERSVAASPAADDGSRLSAAALVIAAAARFAVSDNLYQRDRFGSQILARLARAPRFNAWMADSIRQFCGQRVLEIGSGIGKMTRELVPRPSYVASDINPIYLQTLESMAVERPYLRVAYCDVSDGTSFPRLPGGYDTVICLNVIEHVRDDRAALGNIKSVLAADGRAIILVPQGQWNYGTLDEVLEHERRYSERSLRALAADCDMEVLDLFEFNRIGTVAWFLNGKLARRREFGLLQIWTLNLLTPVFRRMEPWLPLPGLSLIAVLQPKPVHARN